MKDKKGFTLIELLAVIVILAVIALIATPAIVNVIENARKKAFEDTAYGVLESLKLNYVERVATEASGQTLEFEFPTSELKLSGEEPAGGNAKIDIKGNISFAIYDKDKKWCAKKDVTSEKVTIEDYTEDNCEVKKFSFATDSWKTIVANIKSGNSNVYNIGDEKEITLSGEYSGIYKVRIANISTPTECSNNEFSQTACGFVVEFKDIITKAKMNLTDKNIGGWPSSEMYNLVNTNIYNSLPEDLKTAIIETKVVSSHGSNDSNNFTSIDKLYLLSTKEVYGKEGTLNIVNNDTSDINTRQLDYYKDTGVTTGNYSGTKKKYLGLNSIWWLRSAYSVGSTHFYSVNSDGNWKTFYSPNTVGVSPVFRIGN